MADSTEPATIAELVTTLSGAEGFDDNRGDFDVLREALAATNLIAAVADDTADLSVFAPTDAAFIQTAIDLGVVIDEANAEASALNGILAAATELAGGDAEAGLALIADILLYHVVAGSQTLAQLDAAGSIQPLFPDATLEVNGLKVVDQEPDLPSADVVLSDVATGNGTVQAIDRVLLPLDIEGVSTILGVAESAGIFTNLLRSLELTGLDDAVAALTDTTVFAPTDAAFAALAADLGYAGDPNDADAVFTFIAGALTGLAEDGDPIPLLTNILLYHVAPGAKSAEELGAADSIDNLLGATLSGDGASLSDIASEITDATIVAADIAVGDNIIQGLDRVMLPLELQALADILGSTEADALTGGNADNVMRGFAGDDMMMGGRGADDLRGNQGADEINAGLGDDAVRGGFGQDVIMGMGGDDVLRGGVGADNIDGGGGDDTIFGGFGRDTLKGGAGDDALSGGPGADVLDFRELSGDDLVYVFSDLDAAWFDQSAIADFAALEAASTQEGANLVIAIGDDSVTFLNRSFADLNEDAFLFV